MQNAGLCLCPNCQPVCSKSGVLPLRSSNQCQIALTPEMSQASWGGGGSFKTMVYSTQPVLTAGSVLTGWEGLNKRQYGLADSD